MRLGYHGESLFVAFQLRLGFTVYADIASRLGKPEEASWALAHREKLDKAIQDTCWDGNWFIWAIAEDGTVYGTKTYEEGQVYFKYNDPQFLEGRQPQVHAIREGKFFYMDWVS